MTPTDILGNIKLCNADCMDVMKTFKDKQFDLAICDPPYGIGAENHAGNKENGWTQWAKKDWDKAIPTAEYWQELFRVSKNQIVWGANYMTEYLPPKMGWIVWDKGKRDFSLADGELAWTSFDKAMRIFTYARAKALKEGKIHPTQKPVDLYKWLLQNYAKDGDTILDTHFGSLSIGIACHDLKFDLTAIELDKDYYEQAKQRLINHQRQLKLF
ncbi:MAG TPA: site-specific DNA-methyltransferase [Clostridiales bacterium]|nr:site-specific DNA-methyltransferase [Clostridiales bacterium]